MRYNQMSIRRVLNWKLLVGLSLLLTAGCTVGAQTSQLTPAEQIQAFITDLARQALAAFVL